MAPSGQTKFDGQAFYSASMHTDEFGNHYSDLLDGSYDCVDRIVLNGYFTLGHTPGGFRGGVDSTMIPKNNSTMLI